MSHLISKLKGHKRSGSVPSSATMIVDEPASVPAAVSPEHLLAPGKRRSRSSSLSAPSS